MSLIPCSNCCVHQTVACNKCQNNKCSGHSMSMTSKPQFLTCMSGNRGFKKVSRSFIKANNKT